MTAIAVMTLSSCSGGGNASESLFLGTLPAIHGEMQQAKKSIQEEYKAVQSESQAKSLMAKAEKLEKEYSEKIEKAAQSLDNKEVRITDGDLKVTSPVTLNYCGFFSKFDMTPEFNVKGGAEATTDIMPEGKYPLTAYAVYIVGYGPDSQELFKCKVGHMDAEVNNGTAVIKAGTPVRFDRFHISNKETDAYQQATTLKLEARY